MNELDTAIAPKEKLVADLQAAVSDAEELLAATASQTGQKIVELRERMQTNLRLAHIKLADAEAAARIDPPDGCDRPLYCTRTLEGDRHRRRRRPCWSAC